MRDRVLTGRGIDVAFEGVRAIASVDVSLDEGAIVGLIGPNGAGKTTLVNVLSGFQRPTAGTVRLGDQDVTGWSPQRLAGARLARTFQSARLFPALSLAENVEIGALGVGAKADEARIRAAELLDGLGLGARAAMPAATLTHGEERKATIARALATRPALILLDEPAAGLNDAESEELTAILRRFRDDLGIGMMVIEHDLRLILSLCDRIQVLDHGATIALGSPQEVRADPEVLRAYIGSEQGVAES